MTSPFLRTTLALTVAVAAVVGALVGTIEDGWFGAETDNHVAVTEPDRLGALLVLISRSGVDWPSGQGERRAVLGVGCCA